MRKLTICSNGQELIEVRHTFSPRRRIVAEAEQGFELIKRIQTLSIVPVHALTGKGEAMLLSV